MVSKKKSSNKPSRPKPGTSAKSTAARRKASAAKAAGKEKTATAGKPSVTKKAAGKKVAAKKTATKKTATKKTITKKAVTKKAVVKKAGAPRKAGASKKAPAKKTSVKKASARKTSAKKASAKNTATRKPAAPKAAPQRSAQPRVGQQQVDQQQSQGSGAPKSGKGNGSRTGLLSGPMHGFEPYQPKKGEPYMSKDQLDHFRRILSTWKRQLMEEVDRTVHHMQDEAANFPDPNDRATQESEFSLELRTRDRERKLLRKIESALHRIEDGSYGFCEETGEEIGLRRLEARPVATLSLEAQERRELAERQYGERDERYR